METMTMYRKIDAIYDEVKDSNIYVALTKLEELKNQLLQEEKQKDIKGSKKKAVTKITSISKRIFKQDKRPVLGYQKKVDDMYCFTDSYFLTMTKDAFLPIFDDLTEEERTKGATTLTYPDVKRLVDIDDTYKASVKDIDFQEVETRRKTKDEKLMFYDVTFKGNKSFINQRRDKVESQEVIFERRFNTEYLMIAYNLLDIKNNIEDIVCYTNIEERLSPCVFKNVKTKEFVLILPMRKPQ